MVVSILDKSVSYKENKEIYSDDDNYETDPFLLNYLDKTFIAVLGKEKYTFITNNILFFPIYIVDGDDIIEQIGVFEILISEIDNILDKKSEVDIDKLDEPLYFSFVDKEYLDKYDIDNKSGFDEQNSDDDEYISDDSDDYTINSDNATDDDDLSSVNSDEDTEEETDKTESDNTDDEEEEETESDEEDNDELTEDIINKYFEEDETEYKNNETKENNKQIMNKFKEGDNWVQEHFKNKNYKILDNDYNVGDCFFTVVRDAFNSIGKNITIPILRKILAINATEEVFNEYKLMYDMFNDEKNRLYSEMKKIKKQIEQLRKEYEKEEEKGKKKSIVKTSNKLIEEFKQIKKEYFEKDPFINEYKFMDGIKTLEDFKKVIQTCKFWGETWAISTLERALNIKMIILSEEAYIDEDINNVLQCGQLNDTILSEKGEFKPKYYIITEWQGNHYRNISYKDKLMLEFEDIPYQLKKDIVEICNKGEKGTFSIIPKFKEFKEEMNDEENTSDEEDIELDIEPLE